MYQRRAAQICLKVDESPCMAMRVMFTVMFTEVQINRKCAPVNVCDL